MLCSLSNLSKNDLNEISQLENEINSTLLAFSCTDINIAALSDNQLKKIQALENKLGLSLVAVSP